MPPAKKTKKESEPETEVQSKSETEAQSKSEEEILPSQPQPQTVPEVGPESGSEPEPKKKRTKKEQAELAASERRGVAKPSQPGMISYQAPPSAPR